MSFLIGTGFYASKQEHRAKADEFLCWQENTGFNKEVVIVDNSDVGLWQFSPHRIIRVKKNLGHMSAPARHAGRFTGWSVSWIIPAMMAYSEGVDFIYKEQDCFAFGNWIEEIQTGDFTVGRNSIMPCEQSLFFIRHGSILSVIQKYMAIERADTCCSTEEKFVLCGATFHGLGCGRERPLTTDAKTWYAQKLTRKEINELTHSRLV